MKCTNCGRKIKGLTITIIDPATRPADLARPGVRLINRTTRDMSLTEAGLELFSVLQPAMDSIQAAVHGLMDAQSEPTGVLKIDTSRTAARLLLNPVIEVFLQRHPKLQQSEHQLYHLRRRRILQRFLPLQYLRTQQPSHHLLQ